MISSPPPAASDCAGIARALRECLAAERARRGRQRFCPEVGDADWHDWRQQFRHRLTTTRDLAERLVPTPDEPACGTVLREFRMGITPDFLSLVDPDDAADPLRRRLVPRAEQAASLSAGSEFPSGA